MAVNSGLAIILVTPQMAANIGAVARAMLNCGVTDLRLVRPRDGWPQEAAYPMASGADFILDQARVFETTKEAIADLNLVFATTARSRDMNKPVVDAPQAGSLLADPSLRTGVLFGPERAGMENEDISLCDQILSIPLNPEFSSLNLAQAVLLVCYEYAKFVGNFSMPLRHQTLAPKEKLVHFLDFVEERLSEAGFFPTLAQKPTMILNMRNMFHRMELSEQDLLTLYGMVRSLSSPRPKS